MKRAFNYFVWQSLFWCTNAPKSSYHVTFYQKVCTWQHKCGNIRGNMKSTGQITTFTLIWCGLFFAIIRDKIHQQWYSTICTTSYTCWFDLFWLTLFPNIHSIECKFPLQMARNSNTFFNFLPEVSHVFDKYTVQNGGAYKMDQNNGFQLNTTYFPPWASQGIINHTPHIVLIHSAQSVSRRVLTSGKCLIVKSSSQTWLCVPY